MGNSRSDVRSTDRPKRSYIIGDLNKVLLIGRITRPVTLRKTHTTGREVLNLSMVHNHFFMDGDGARKSYSTFIDVVVYGPNAAYLAERITVGTPLFVEGRLSSREYVNPTDGIARKIVEIVGVRTQILETQDSSDAALVFYEQQKTGSN